MKYGIALSACLLLLSACGQFSKLRQDVQLLENNTYRLTARATAPDCKNCNIFALVFSGEDKDHFSHYNLLSSGEDFSTQLLLNETEVFFFNDANEDFHFSEGEAFAWANISPEQIHNGEIKIDVTLKVNQEKPAPNVGNVLTQAAAQLEFPLVRGDITQLDHARFSAKTANMGMWQPVEFVRQGNAGVFQLQPFDAHKQLIVFVHGIDGHPAQFQTLINQLDADTQQAWVFYYPSGLRLENLANGLYQIVRELHLRYQLPETHIVAHSMGGLVSYRTVQLCEFKGGCPHISQLITIATPFGGHKAAQSGVEYSPVIMPVWHDMAPNSDYLAQLGTEGFKQAEHHLIFAYLPEQSSDGVIALESQLNQPIQWRASTVRGLDTQHVDVLSNTATVRHVNSLLAH